MTAVIAAQPGPQERFLASPADIAIYGGGAGGGKTWALLLEPLRHRAKAEFSAVVFRRTLTQVKNPGGLWDESAKLWERLPSWRRWNGGSVPAPGCGSAIWSTNAPYSTGRARRSR